MMTQWDGRYINALPNDPVIQKSLLSHVIAPISDALYVQS